MDRIEIVEIEWNSIEKSWFCNWKWLIISELCGAGVRLLSLHFSSSLRKECKQLFDKDDKLYTTHIGETNKKKKEVKTNRWRNLINSCLKLSHSVCECTSVCITSTQWNWSSHMFLFAVEIFEIIWIFSRKFMWFYFNLVCVCASHLLLTLWLFLSISSLHTQIGYELINSQRLNFWIVFLCLS